jgi:hypothetical protein
MDDEDLSKLASQFISLWQENFAKTMTDPQILAQMMQSASTMQNFNMQQFYDKNPFTQSAAAAFKYPHESGADEHDRGSLLSRIDELEKRISKLEAAKKRNPNKSKK